LERALARLRCRWGCRLSRSCSGSLLASSTALALRSKYQFLRGAALSYIEVVRNTPFLLQVFFIFFGLPSLGLSFSPWSAAILANAQTVESIKKGGVLKVGAQVAQVPWGFTDSSGKLTGFDIEVMEMSCLASLRWQ